MQLAHRSLIANVTASAERAGFERPLVFLGLLPLFHSLPLTATMLIPFFYGSTVVYHKRFQPRAVLESIPKHRIQVLLAVPSMFRLLIKAHQSEPVDLSSVIIAIAGGEPLPPAGQHVLKIFRHCQQEWGGLHRFRRWNGRTGKHAALWLDTSIPSG